MATERLSTPATRRTILTAALAIPVAALATGLPATAQAASADRTAWDQAFAAMRRAEVVSDADAFNHDRIHDAWQAGRGWLVVGGEA